MATPIDVLMNDPTIRTATQYIGVNYVFRATRVLFKTRKKNARNKYHAPSKRVTTMVVTIGTPNYKEREFIKQATLAGVGFPLKKIQIKHFSLKK
jgi:hypothetical protein